MGNILNIYMTYTLKIIVWRFCAFQEGKSASELARLYASEEVVMLLMSKRSIINQLSLMSRLNPLFCYWCCCGRRRFCWTRCLQVRLVRWFSESGNWREMSQWSCSMKATASSIREQREQAETYVRFAQISTWPLELRSYKWLHDDR